MCNIPKSQSAFTDKMCAVCIARSDCMPYETMVPHDSKTPSLKCSLIAFVLHSYSDIVWETGKWSKWREQTNHKKTKQINEMVWNQADDKGGLTARPRS